jgi:4-hydroxy-3-methylbut-2-enyl diphosphate reductase IspH
VQGHEEHEEGVGDMSTAKEAILNGLTDISDDIQDEFEVLEGLYKLIKLQHSRESVKNQGTLSTDEVREYFAKKQQKAGLML